MVARVAQLDAQLVQLELVEQPLQIAKLPGALVARVLHRALVGSARASRRGADPTHARANVAEVATRGAWVMGEEDDDEGGWGAHALAEEVMAISFEQRIALPSGNPHATGCSENMSERMRPNGN